MSAAASPTNAAPPASRTRRKRVSLGLGAFALGVIALAWTPASRHARAARLLTSLTAPPTDTSALRVEESSVTSSGVAVPVVRYEPRGVADAPGVVLVHGVHHLGMREPRLVAFARALAGAGLRVVTPDIDALRGFRIDASGVPLVGDVAAAQAQYTGARHVAVIGISFGGGLSLLAASRAHDGRAIGAVASIGGHADLARVSRFLLSRGGDAGQAGGRLTPHPYGSRVIALRYLDALVAPADLAPARAALLTWLSDDFTRAHELAERVSPESRATLDALLAQGYPARVIARLERALERDLPALHAASPVTHIQRVRVPVFLLHGADDPIIPASETRALAERTPARILAGALVTPALRHAELRSEPTLRDRVDIVRFVAALLGATSEAAR